MPAVFRKPDSVRAPSVRFEVRGDWAGNRWEALYKFLEYR